MVRGSMPRLDPTKASERDSACELVYVWVQLGAAGWVVAWLIYLPQAGLTGGITSRPYYPPILDMWAAGPDRSPPPFLKRLAHGPTNELRRGLQSALVLGAKN
ncbi:hypothetical protein TcWFU_002298 [Taenia crassiceps]|uniref:Uncharacterized protein n=1 Tax=Taenia crassiceps TaxID=6207 RepID=A0ABR4Q0G3_9CEST